MEWGGNDGCEDKDGGKPQLANFSSLDGWILFSKMQSKSEHVTVIVEMRTSKWDARANLQDFQRWDSSNYSLNAMVRDPGTTMYNKWEM